MIDPMFTMPAFRALESALNLAISLSPEVQQELASQQGQVVCLRCQQPELCMYIELGERCRVMHYSDQPEDAGLEGELKDWVELVRADDKASQLINGNLRMTGNSKWLLQMGDVIGTLDIDWEGQLANIIGDVPAHLIGEGSRQLMRWLKPLPEKFRGPGENLQSALNGLFQATLGRKPTGDERLEISDIVDDIGQRFGEIRDALGGRELNTDKDEEKDS